MTAPTSSAPRPEPVTKAGAIAGIVSAVLMLAGLVARALGLVSSDVDLTAVATQASDVVLGAAALWSVLAPIALAVRARAKVTPLGDPRDALGRVLSAVDDAGPIVAELRHYLDELTGHAIDTITAAAAEVTPILPAPTPALEDPATTALLGPSVYDQLAAERPAMPPAPAPEPAAAATAG